MTENIPTTQIQGQLPRFEYETAADYIPAMEERFREEMDGMRLVEEAERRNDEARIANSQQFVKSFDSLGKFSKTLGPILEQRREKRDSELRKNSLLNIRRAKALGLDLTFKGLQSYNQQKDNKENFIADTGYYNILAAEAEAKGDYDLANYLRNLTGHQSLIFKEQLAKQAAINFSANLEAAKKDLHYIDEESGTKITWFNSNTAQKQRLIDQFLVDSGLNSVDEARLSNEFLDEHFWPKVDQERALIIREANRQQADANKAERLNSIDEQLLLSAQTNSLGQKMLEVINTNFMDLGGSRGAARKYLIERLDTMLANEQITRGEYEAVLAHEFIPDGHKTPTTIGKHWEKDFGNIENRIALAEAKSLEARQARSKVKRLSLMNEIKQIAEETGQLPSEQDLIDIGRKWMEENPGEVLPPEWYTKVLTREDRADDDYESYLEYKKANGIKIEAKDYNKIHDDTLRDKWKKFANSPAGQGIDPIYADIRDDEVPSIVGRALGDLTGKNDYKSPEYLRNVRKAKARYNSVFRRYVDSVGAEKAHDIAMKNVEDQMAAGGFNTETLGGSVEEAGVFVQKVNDGIDTIQSNSGKDLGKFLHSTVIPGSEDYVKRLEAYNKDPENNSIPIYYVKLAETLKDWTPWQLANAQYKASTGKEFKTKPDEIKYLERNTNIYTGRLITNHGNKTKVKRAELINSNVDFNSPQYIS